MSLKGRVFDTAQKAIHVRKVRAEPNTATRLVAEQEEDALFGMWPAVQLAAWQFLWERRDRTLIGWWFIRIRWGHQAVQDLFTKAFGACPFPWETGPRG